MRLEAILYDEFLRDLYDTNWLEDWQKQKIADVLVRSTMHALERRLPQLGVQNFMHMLMAENLYRDNAAFHHTVEQLAQAIIMAALGRAPLSRAQMEEKVKLVTDFSRLL